MLARLLRRDVLSPGRCALSAALLACAATAAQAACPQELSVYTEPEANASLEFTPTAGNASTAHAFRITFPENSVVLDGVVMWTDGVARPHGIVMHKCPEGDITGDELAACTVWEGVVYAVDGQGNVGLLPSEGAAAANQLLLPDFAPALRQSSAYGMTGLSRMPWDAFRLSGCQE